MDTGSIYVCAYTLKTMMCLFLNLLLLFCHKKGLKVVKRIKFKLCFEKRIISKIPENFSPLHILTKFRLRMKRYWFQEVYIHMYLPVKSMYICWTLGVGWISLGERYNTVGETRHVYSKCHIVTFPWTILLNLKVEGKAYTGFLTYSGYRL